MTSKAGGGGEREKVGTGWTVALRQSWGQGEKSVQCSNSKRKGKGPGGMGEGYFDGTREATRAKGPGERAGPA